ncbi:MAG: 16S rRNA (cytosine(1402)-N(4))-methyltransferase RsmH, partial [Limnohabitans sp.]
MTGTSVTWSHEPVLLEESIQAVLAHPQGRYVDATFGRGGHTRALLEALGPEGRVLALDRDPQAVEAARDISDARLQVRHSPFSSMSQCVAELGWSGVDGVLMDLGVSSPQLDDASRGFSFRADAPLDMRMDTTHGQTAAQFLATVGERELAEVIRDYGEERFAGSIAKAIVSRRQGGRPVCTTRELAEVVAGAVKTREPGQNPATRTFQA